jgi:PQQ-dependent catabolism-associated CXXCW motif protein
VKESSFSEEKEAKRLLFALRGARAHPICDVRRARPTTKQKSFWFFFFRKRTLFLPFFLALIAAAPEPANFRLDHYRDDVPATLSGAQVVNPAGLRDMLRTLHPILIDVLPDPTPPPDPRPEMPRLKPPHQDIPGSLWLPDVGRGAIAPALDQRFRETLARIAQGKKDRPLVFYCLSRCWMSWNAAKRAVAYGYTRVVWFPDGADGWQKSGGTLADATPEWSR